jgi:hypothetical protein
MVIQNCIVLTYAEGLDECAEPWLIQEFPASHAVAKTRLQTLSQDPSILWARVDPLAQAPVV